jgi:hypothetical protein
MCLLVHGSAPGCPFNPGLAMPALAVACWASGGQSREERLCVSDVIVDKRPTGAIFS